MEDKIFMRKLNLLFAYSKGAETRRRIIDALKERPKNANQLSVALKYNYRTIKHHTNILKKEEMISEITQDRYNKVFVISALLASKMQILAPIFNMEAQAEAHSITPRGTDFYQSIFNGINIGIIVTDNSNRILKTNTEISRIFGFQGASIADNNSNALGDSILSDKNISGLLSKNGAVNNYSKEITDKYGNRHFVLISVSNIQDDAFRSVGRCYMVHDIVNYAMNNATAGRSLGTILPEPAMSVPAKASATLFSN